MPNLTKNLELNGLEKFPWSQLETVWTDRDEVEEWNNAPIEGNNLYAGCKKLVHVELSYTWYKKCYKKSRETDFNVGHITCNLVHREPIFYIQRISCSPRLAHYSILWPHLDRSSRSRVVTAEKFIFEIYFSKFQNIISGRQKIQKSWGQKTKTSPHRGEYFLRWKF
jgi:hypothetical protein